MIVKLLSFADMLAFAITLFYAVNFLPSATMRYAAFYLLLKGGVFVLFYRDFASIVDFLIGIYFLLIWAGVFSNIFITAVAALWLLQKSVMGML